MAEIFVVRHGQAAFGTHNYDRLTELGWAQSQALGHYFNQAGIKFKTVITGELQRHKETLTGLSKELPDIPTATNYNHFDELDFHGLVDAYLSLSREQPDLSDRATYFRCFRRALNAWKNSELMGVKESWIDFDARALQCMKQILTLSGPVLIITSGGIASAILRHALELSPDKMFDLNLQALNTGITRYFSRGERLMLHSFNAVPHLESDRRRDMITYA